jgi:very-short-patch-repair endonuclease
VYAWVGLADDTHLHVAAAALILPGAAAFSHRTAAWLHGVATIAPGAVPAVSVPSGVCFAGRGRLRVRHAPLPPADVVLRRRMPATTPLRTAFDLARTEPRAEAVACVDALLHAGLVEKGALAGYVAAHAGWRGVRIAADVVERADGRAESPMESHLRIVLLDGGLPRPAVNEPIRAADGSFLARPDLRIGHVIVEYDGALHREAGVFSRDLRRQNRLIDAGYSVLRYGAGDISLRPADIVAQVRRALADRPSILARSTS